MELSVHSPPNERNESNGRFMLHYDWDAVIDQVCVRISSGEAVKRICDDKDMPSWPMLWRALKDNEDYNRRYEEAKHAKAEAFDDKLDYLYNVVLEDDPEKRKDPRAVRAALEIIKTQRGHLAPHKYHDKSIGHTIQPPDESMREKLLRANERVIDAEYKVVEE